MNRFQHLGNRDKLSEEVRQLLTPTTQSIRNESAKSRSKNASKLQTLTIDVIFPNKIGLNISAHRSKTGSFTASETQTSR